MADEPRPLLEHLVELRRRLIICVVGFALGFCLCYSFAQELFGLFAKPLADVLGAGHRLIYTGLTEAFTTYVKVAAFGALVLSIPLLTWQGWRFVGPGLYENERPLFFSALILTPLLFLAGALFAYFVVCPLAYHFFVSFETTQTALPIQLEARMGEYLSFVIRLMVVFGLCFEMPLVLLVLARLKIVSRETLLGKWRYFVLGIFAISALITPPDMVSMLALALPLCLLYGLSLWFIGIIPKSLK
jgi:sec-independent protein translocase protein TatC